MFTKDSERIHGYLMILLSRMAFNIAIRTLLYHGFFATIKQALKYVHPGSTDYITIYFRNTFGRCESLQLRVSASILYPDILFVDV